MNRESGEWGCKKHRENRVLQRAGRFGALRRLCSDRRGSAMVTMIVVVLFITILATTLLYVSGMNFQIKQTDYRNQMSFYSGETALENVRAQMLVDMSNAAAQAYQSVCSDYVTLDTGDARKWEYHHRFVDELQAEWVKHGDWKTWLDTYMVSGATLRLTVPDADGNGSYSNAEVLDIHEDEGYVVVQGLEVTYTNSAGYTSVITTDFYVQAPTLNWDVNASEMTAIADINDKQKAKVQTKVKAADYVEYVNWTKQ